MNLPSLSFRARLALVAAGAVALAVVAASAVVFVVVRGELRREFDKTLSDRAQEIPLVQIDPVTGYLVLRGPGFGGFVGYVQAVRADGRVFLTPTERVRLPVTGDVRAVAQGKRGPYFSDAKVQGTDLRVLTVPAGPGFALQIARSAENLHHTLWRLTILLILIAAGGVAIALALGFAVAQAALAPVRRLTGATETVTATGDLSERIETRGDDELSRLAQSFNTMLGALEESARSQRQLVSDASHELRTPLTEMTALVNELVELARGGTHPLEAEDVRLDLLVAEVLERARRDYPNVEFVADLQPSELRGVPSTIARAVSNLLDNAAKWSPPGGKVEVAVQDGQVSIRDHGPGIDEDDLPYVFDRFYRAAAARKLPGSGLGLAIVKQVAEAHGGRVEAERVADGGTRMTLVVAPNGRVPG